VNNGVIIMRLLWDYCIIILWLLCDYYV